MPAGKFLENILAVLAILKVLFESFSGKFCLNFLTLTVSVSPNMLFFFFVNCYWHIYPPITRKRRSAVRARLGVAGRLSTTLRWGNPVKCFCQRHNK